VQQSSRKPLIIEIEKVKLIEPVVANEAFKDPVRTINKVYWSKKKMQIVA
jgi:hypothetical protein